MTPRRTFSISLTQAQWEAVLHAIAAELAGEPTSELPRFHERLEAAQRRIWDGQERSGHVTQADD